MRAGIAKRSAMVAALSLAVVSLVIFSGCSWLGKGKDVADAFTATNNAKSASLTASFSVTTPRRLGRPAETETFTMTGAYDFLDPAHPKQRYDLRIDGERFYVVQPGNGKVYFEYDGEVVATKLPKTQNTPPVDSGLGKKLRDALAASIVNFRDGAPLTAPSGAQVPTILADIKRSTLCGKSLRQSVRAMNASAERREAGMKRVKKREAKRVSRECNRSLPRPVQLTFGIAAGYMTDFILDMPIRDGGRVFETKTELHLEAIGQPQGDFPIPKKKARTVRSGGFSALVRDQSSESSSVAPAFSAAISRLNR